MKLLGSLILFIVLLGSALGENKIEFHSEHESNGPHSLDITYHSDVHKDDLKKTSSETSSDCDHYHMHCSNFCVGLLIPNNENLKMPSSYFSEIRFNQELLSLKDFSSSLYRPPIS